MARENLIIVNYNTAWIVDEQTMGVVLDFLATNATKTKTPEFVFGMVGVRDRVPVNRKHTCELCTHTWSGESVDCPNCGTPEHPEEP